METKLREKFMRKLWRALFQNCKGFLKFCVWKDKVIVTSGEIARPKVPRPGPVLLSKTTPQMKSCAYVPQSARPGATAILKDPSAKLFKLYLPACEFIRGVVQPKQSLQRLSDSAV